MRNITFLIKPKTLGNSTRLLIAYSLDGPITEKSVLSVWDVDLSDSKIYSRTGESFDSLSKGAYKLDSIKIKDNDNYPFIGVINHGDDGLAERLGGLGAEEHLTYVLIFGHSYYEKYLPTYDGIFIKNTSKIADILCPLGEKIAF